MSRARILRAILVCAAVAWLGAACQDDLVEPAGSPAPRSPGNGTGLGSISLSSTALTASLSPGATFAFSSIPGLDRAYGINDAGLVVGDRGGNNIAAVWTATGGATTIGRLDGTTSCCSGFTDVNAAGEAAGFSHTDVGVSAVFWSAALGSTDLMVSGRATGQGINDAGDVVGITFTLGSPFKAYFRPRTGSAVLLQLPPGAVSVFAYDINNAGNIVGDSDIPGNGGGHALFWTRYDAAPLDLGTLGGARSRAWAVNDAGDIVGWALTGGGQQHAFVWTSSSGMVDLTTWPQGCAGTSEASGINAAGVIVGRCDGRPVLWTAVEGMRELPLPSGIMLGEPLAINARNEIVGIYNNFGSAHWTVANQAPSASVNGPYSGTFGTPVAFSSAGSSDPDGDPLTYAWEFGDGGTASSADPSHAYEPGTYAASLTVTDPIGAANSATATVTIAKALPAIAWANPGSILVGAPYGEALAAAAIGVDGTTLPGTFVYRNAAGDVLTSTTVPGVGANQVLAVEFTPADQSRYTNAAKSVQLSVLYAFTGFLRPVDNKPLVNAVNSGQAIPVKFSLNGDRGLDILQPGSPTSASYGCGAAPEDVIEETVTASNSGLTYDATSGQYTYVWKTEKAWGKSCRKLVLTFRDGSRQEALFHFPK